MPAALERAGQLADLVELRLDCLADDSELDDALGSLTALLRARALPFILTFRPAEQGGARTLDLAARLDFWTRRLPPLLTDSATRPDFVDIELDLLSDPQRRAALLAIFDRSTLICSQHDFTGVPPDLEAIYERMTQTPAHVLKLAVRADDITDCLPVLRLLERARREGREMIAVAMGEAGLLTRVLAPSRGAFLTFGSPDAGSATAPGQTTAAELRDLYRVHSITERTMVTGLVGSPVSHSLSPHMHNAAFAARGADAVYIPFEVRDARAFLRRMAHPHTRELDWNLRGFSVTAPHKSAVVEELDHVEPAAREIGAVNTVVVEGEELRGYNTDAAAALAPLRGFVSMGGARIALIGAGGAARAVLWSLRETGARTVVFARNVERARAVAAEFGAEARALEGARFEGFDVVINATPLGTRGASESATAATAGQLRGARVAYDLVYNPSETLFMREARVAGCERTVGGLAMLVAQAAAQFELWTGERAPIEVMERAASGRLR